LNVRPDALRGFLIYVAILMGLLYAHQRWPDLDFILRLVFLTLILIGSGVALWRFARSSKSSSADPLPARWRRWIEGGEAPPKEVGRKHERDS
jgi:hypothetical protein